MIEDVKALTDEELMVRYRGARKTVPGIKADPMVRRRALEDVRRYADELDRRHPPNSAAL
ncbi:MAG: hypothetical protein M3046_02465 [Actinomycetota bacterium]|nr:hypothetical protein [Actinomycetota bacterium]